MIRQVSSSKEINKTNSQFLIFTHSPVTLINREFMYVNKYSHLELLMTTQVKFNIKFQETIKTLLIDNLIILSKSVIKRVVK